MCYLFSYTFLCQVCITDIHSNSERLLELVINCTAIVANGVLSNYNELRVHTSDTAVSEIFCVFLCFLLYRN